MAAKKKKNRSFLSYLTPVLEFMIGIFGAMAIIGVFFKIQEYPNYEFYMQVGFLGEAAAFIIMGVFALLGGFFGRDRDVVEEDGRAASASGEVTASFRKVMDEKMNASLDAAMQSLNDEVHRFGGEMRAIGAEMEQTRGSVRQMRGEMNRMGEQGFADDAALLGESIKHMSGEMHAMGSQMERSRAAVEQAHAVLAQMADGDLAADAEKFEEGMRVLGAEVHEMGAEMGPARRAIQGMRDELDRVVSGNLAGDAERLGGGMKQLGDEMSEAGTAVEQIRSDLEHLALRFRQFNNPVPEPHANGVAKDHKSHTHKAQQHVS